MRDPMLSRIDLAYSLNMHMAQGVTAEKAITAMSSAETNLTSQQLFNVAVTRVRSELTVVVNDTQKVSQQLDRNTGIKTSAVETLGRLNIDGPGSSLGGTSPASTPTVSVRIGQVQMSGADDLSTLPRMPEFTDKDAARYAKPDEIGVARKHDDMGVNVSAAKESRQLPVPEKNLGLEL